MCRSSVARLLAETDRAYNKALTIVAGRSVPVSVRRVVGMEGARLFSVRPFLSRQMPRGFESCPPGHSFQRICAGLNEPSRIPARRLFLGKLSLASRLLLTRFLHRRWFAASRLFRYFGCFFLAFFLTAIHAITSPQGASENPVRFTQLQHLRAYRSVPESLARGCRNQRVHRDASR
jgi:hypothetical protein